MFVTQFSLFTFHTGVMHMYFIYSVHPNYRPTLTNVERLRTLINMMAADLGQSIAHSGHSYALSLAESSLTPSAKLGELLGGLSQVNAWSALSFLRLHGSASP